MKANHVISKSLNESSSHALAILCTLGILSLGQSVVLAQQAQPQVQTTGPAATEETAKISDAQLDSLVAPIALYPDPLLAQTLAASTYPLEIIQLQQWMDQNKNLKDQALADAVQKQKWDPSIQAMVAVPDVVQRLAGNVQWTTDLGNAFLSQQSDVMDAVQRMRAKAEGKGALKTTSEQKVETKTEAGKQVIVVEQASPEVVYVPSYDPMVVYGEPEYPYPSCVTPWCTPGMGLAWGTGFFLGAAWGGGWWGDCNWGDGDFNINNNNNYVNHYNRANNIRGEGGKWQHRPEHRGNAPYGDRRTADRFGGRGPGGAGGAGGIGKPGGPGGIGGVGKPGGVAGVGKPGGVGGVGKPGGVGGVGSAGGVGKPGGVAGAGKPGGVGKPGGAGKPSSAVGANKPRGAGKPGGGAVAGNQRPSTKSAASRPSSGNANRVGSHSPSSINGGGAFGGGSGNVARASSSRGGHSMGGNSGFSRAGGGGGGFHAAGGGRGGGGRGGGGRGGGGGGRRR